MGPWASVAFLWVWAGSGTSWALFVAAVAWTVGIVTHRPPMDRWTSVGSILALVGILAGFHAERQVTEILNEWDAYWDRRVDQVGDLLSDELDRRQLEGEAAADALVALHAESGGAIPQEDLSDLRRRYRSAALALYDDGGALVAWEGTHRGMVPESVQRGERRQSYRDL
ncbi:MAG: hypothetical protein R3304_06950, partial [Longimicrobiales bacterium]|nr:hypothetical protein [Longimicrobiales bacterium]